MAFLNYEYKMIVNYSEDVNKCYFTLKSFPVNDFRQISISHNVGLVPPTSYTESKDSFGNHQIIGSETVSHKQFVFTTSGMVETHPTSITCGIDENTIGMYKYPYGKCIPGESIMAFFSELEKKVGTCTDVRQKCTLIMNELFEKIVYETGSTAVETTAEESFSRGKGVCQDYSHIYICLLRLFKIPARYVCGLIVGEGQSHAWVEAACDGNYVAFDPTHNREITDEYIKLGVGRDATDCAINRGVMWGGGIQSQEIFVTVEKYY